MAVRMNRLEGRDGKATIKGLGSLVGEISQWTLTRRGDVEAPVTGLFDLRAVFSFVVAPLLLDPDYSEDRELTLVVGRSQVIRVKLDDPGAMRLQGKVLSMEGVKVEWSRP